MIGNTFGTAYRITTFGESHGPGVGVIIDGVPANLKLNSENIRDFLARRKTSQSAFTSSRVEQDHVEILSGVNSENTTLGTPLTLLVRNENQKPADYNADFFRPSHADYSYWKKYQINAPSGGGRASARETVARVLAGAIAEQVLTAEIPNFSIQACVSKVRNISCDKKHLENFTREEVEKSLVRCAEPETSKKMEEEILRAKTKGDTVGGIIFCRIKNYPAGCGEPVFDKLEAELAKAMLSLPAAKGFDFGSGFSGCEMLGSEHNDAFQEISGVVSTRTNFSGGIQGGISNGEDIYFQVAFKPVSTIFAKQLTITKTLKNTEIENTGRHDPCVLPRAVVMVEAMALNVLLEFFLRQKLNHLKA